MRRVAVGLALVLIAASSCGGNGDDGDQGSDADGGCEKVDAPKPKPSARRTPPEQPLDANTTYRLVVETNCGSFTIELDQKSAPKTTASLVSLARDGFFDDTIFHRVVPSFVVQGGDPTGTGTGGAGYQTVDRPPQDAKYTRGVVAMAKGATDPAGAGSSQFFVVTADDAGLPPEYAIVGRVVDGLFSTVQRIDHLGDAATEKPRETVLIERIRVESG
jgi:peptidyl-prolyl cis-trans isomerase B (cyclophilin B)